MDDRIPAFIAGRTLAARVRPCFKVTKCDLEPIYIKLLTQTRVWCLKLEVANSDFKFEARVNGARRGSRTPDILITNQVLYQLSYAGQVNNHQLQAGGFSLCR